MPIASATSERGLSNRLLGDEYGDEFARNWTTIWTNLLIGRTGGTERRSLIDRAGMQEYLREAFRYNKPYDQMALGADHGHGQLPAGRGGFQRRGQLPGRQDGRGRRAGHGEDVANLPRHGRAVHAVPQPSVQRAQAEPVLGAERVLPADARWSACAMATRTTTTITAAW